MVNLDLKNCIISTKKQYNSGIYDDVIFQTYDKVFIGNFYDYTNKYNHSLRAFPTDYAILCGACYDFNANVPIGEKIYRKEKAKDSVIFTDSQNCENTNALESYVISNNQDDKDTVLADELHCTVVPMMRFDLSKLNSINSSRLGVNFKKYRNKLNSGIDMIVTIGEYPQTCANKTLNIKLEELYQQNKLTRTGKTFTGRYDAEKQTFVQNEEFSYENERYVRVKDESYVGFYSKWMFEDFIGGEKYFWVKVEPIEWIILNWKEIEQDLLNFHKQLLSAKNNTILELVTRNGIIGGMPFYPFEAPNNYHLLWQNSTIRNYLNGYDSGECTPFVNEEFLLKDGGNFKDKNNFLTEAFDCESLIQSNAKMEEALVDLNARVEEARNKLVSNALKRKKQVEQKSNEEENVN